MYFAIISEDVENSLEARLEARPAHLARLKELNDAGRLLLAGPHPISETGSPKGFTGSLVVADFASLADAKTWADADPYCAAGVYSAVTVKPFTKVFPE